MEHMGIDSGTNNIFDDVDKSDFKTDFGSEFPVGLIFLIFCTLSISLPFACNLHKKCVLHDPELEPSYFCHMAHIILFPILVLLQVLHHISIHPYVTASIHFYIGELSVSTVIP